MPNIGCALLPRICAFMGAGVSRREMTTVMRPSRGFDSSEAGNDTSMRNGLADCESSVTAPPARATATHAAAILVRTMWSV